MLGGRFEAAVGLVHDAHRVLNGDELLAAGLDVAVAAPVGRQSQRHRQDLLGSTETGYCSKELPCDPTGGRLVVDVLGAVLAVLLYLPLAGRRLRPRAARTLNTVGRLIAVRRTDVCSSEYSIAVVIIGGRSRKPR
jgi:hypothetical protein